MHGKSLGDVPCPGTTVPGTPVPPPSLKVRGCDCPSDGFAPVVTPWEAFERLFGKGKKVQALGKNKGTTLTRRTRRWPGCRAGARRPPALILGVTGARFGFVPAGCVRPAKFLPALNRLLKPPLHPLWREVLVETSPSWTGGGTGAVFGSVSCPEVGMEMPRAHPSGQPCEEEGEKLGIKPFLHAQPQQEPEENLLYRAKILLGKI